MKIALVYDRVNKIGGAERVLEALRQIWPQAPLYTAVYNASTAPWAKDFKIQQSFLQKFPLAKTHHEFYFPLMPLAFESFCLDDFDVVISVTSAEAKGIITKPKTLHLCYCLTPTRYLWSGVWDYPVPGLLRPLLTKMRVWDQIASARPDTYVAISRAVAQRIKKYYRQEAAVIYPPVDTARWKDHGEGKAENFYLIVSRLVPYKKVDLAIEAFNQLKLPLVVVGEGVEASRLRRLARSNIRFLGQLTDEELLRYYQKCKAVVFPGEEDFGLVPLEAQSCGKAVVAYRAGGALETILEGKTGEFFSTQTAESLAAAVIKFESKKYSPRDCRRQAEKFDIGFFKKRFRSFVETAWRNFYRNISTS